MGEKGAVSHRERRSQLVRQKVLRGVRKEGVHLLPSIPQGPCAGDFIARVYKGALRGWRLAQ